MPKLLKSNSCGPYEINTDWSQSFVESVAALAASRGNQGMTYDEKQALWMLQQDAATQSTLTIGTDTRFYIWRVGNAPTTTEGVDLSFANGFTFQSDTLIGAKIRVRLGSSNAQPETDSYTFDSSTGTIYFADNQTNINIYVDAVKPGQTSVIPQPPLFVELDGSELSLTDLSQQIITLNALDNRIVNQVTVDGGSTYLSGFVKNPSDNYITFTNGATFLAGDKLAFS